MASITPPDYSVFVSAATAFADLVALIPATSWDGPGLGDWDLRSLIGHTSRSLITVSSYLRIPAEREDVTGPAHYYAMLRSYAASSPDIVERGREAGRVLGADPSAKVTELLHQVFTDLDGAGDPLIAVIGGLGIRLSNYLPTRVFELTVHSLDIARATGIDFAPPEQALEAATVLAAQISALTSQAAAVLTALTGRGALPAGFSVV
ncbi:maleylpyruvate isomerase N-terminal domain-containing protein [Mycolicibacterium llatzerense]|uniref:maleylpyruvate isomerase N-terminal domain-containing protein n=1 Tax=Mycolicibacterium llatzerense TaxID=280871 RepID=UPI0021B5F6D9|nr:maleylpyruvate isomerase N-terminal domain-containing protein [Mycolicibacterium llatzerense]MCT7369042.1 mycothiol maleylpyruvate isomerase [Mycolicibacterium llatzerense]